MHYIVLYISRIHVYTYTHATNEVFLAFQNKLPTLTPVRAVAISHSGKQNEIMKQFKSAQNIGNRARKCI